LQQDAADQMIQISWALYSFWSIRGHMSEGRQWMEATLASEASTNSRARALVAAGALAYQQNDLQAAVRLIHEGVALTNDNVIDEETHAFGIQYLGHVAIEQGMYAEAAAYFEQALEQWRAQGHRWGVGSALTGAGYTALHVGNVEHAIRQITAGEKELRAVGALWYLAVNLNMQAALTLQQGDYIKTDVLLRESISISQRLRDTWALPFALEGLAAVDLANGNARRAARLLGAADKLREPLGSTIGNAAWRDVYRQHVVVLERTLDAQTLARMWAEGRAMVTGEAIALALEPIV
jgi:non-specific serine/threonine protein kinase